ncbi:Golgi-associated RAB2 interactor protein 6-like [Stegostoma tigrinum]|uniref:Golgi-associated RAB2 interactor protein 6-like n=1 Tax=Stegostoma tigrinum TaxID=3053191 RepID=UPI00286FB887|nr:Golgi-associated RAB2 interactor protein 6-like [Stegostoma tigrinum]
MVSSGLDTMPLCSPLSKQKICTDTPTPGALQQHLFYGEYDPFKYAPIFESDFVQVTKKGEVLNIHNQVTVVTVGVTSTSPNFNLPNVMLLARPINALREMMCNCTVSEDRCPMELTRQSIPGSHSGTTTLPPKLLPLLSIHLEYRFRAYHIATADQS